MRNRVCHITTVHGPFDSRIFQKECRTLAANGYQVFEVAPHDRDETVDGVDILAIRRVDGRFRRMLFAPWQAFRRALSTKATVYHLHDPELLPVGVVLKLMRKRVIYDAHENLPAQITSKSWMGRPAMRSVVAVIADGLERTAAVFFDSVISVIPEILERFPKKKRTLIRNLPVLEMARSATPADVDKDGIACCYTGGLTRIRGIKEIIRAVSLTRNPVSLWLIGKWESDAFRDECEGMDGFERVKYFGVVTPDTVFAYLKQADIGLVVLHPVENYVRSLPVKSFEYLACRLPVIISDFPYFRGIYSDSVWYVDPVRPEQIAGQIDWIVEHPDEAAAKAAVGRAIVEGEFNWETESVRLLDLYRRLTVEEPITA